MSYQIIIDGKDATKYLIKNSFRWNTGKNGNSDNLSFQIQIAGYIFIPIPPDPPPPDPEQLHFFSGTPIHFFSGESWEAQQPAPPPPPPPEQPVIIDEVLGGQEVLLHIDGMLRFRGNIAQVQSTSQEVDIRRYTIKAVDPNYNASKGELIAETFNEKTANEIITTLLSIYPQLQGYSDEFVDCDIVIDFAFFPHLTFSEVLRDLQRRTAYTVYIDESKKIHFFKDSETAPFEASNATGNIIRNSQKFSEDDSELKNTVIVQGGQYDASDKTTESFIGTGGIDYQLKGEYSGVEVEVDSIKKTVGAGGLHNAEDYDCLYFFSDKKITFRESTKPSAGQTVKVSGFRKLTIFVQVENSESIENQKAKGEVTGVSPHSIVDGSIKTRDSALQVAQAYLAQYAEEQVSGSFQTHKLGLRAGQRIQVINNLLNIDEIFIIQSTSTSFFGANSFKTDVKIAKADKIDAVGSLARLLSQEKKTSTAGDILELFKIFKENVEITDELNIDGDLFSFDESIDLMDDLQNEENKPLIWVHSPYTVTGFSDNKRLIRHDVSPIHV